MHAQSTEQRKELVRKLFSRFRAIYGNKTATMWGDCDVDELLTTWTIGLERFQPTDIRHALSSMQFVYLDYPPTLPQFINLCMDGLKKRMQEVRSLPTPPRTEMPAHVREQLRAFVEKSSSGTTTAAELRVEPRTGETFVELKARLFESLKERQQC